MLGEVIVPELGSDPAEPIRVSFWFAEPGEEILAGDRLVELVVGGVTFDVSAPLSGRLAEIFAAEDDAVRVGDVLGRIESNEDNPSPDESGGTME